jgi:hypothetical protein
MKVKISTSQLDETSWMVCIDDDDLGTKFLFGVDYGSAFERKNRFWLYDSKQEWVLIHNSEDCIIEKLE